MSNLEKVETIVIVVMENRSFDHMLGYLRLPEFAHPKPVQGLRSLTDESYQNPFEGEFYSPFLAKDARLPSDLPHDRDLVDVQLAYSSVSASFLMNGFVDAHYRNTGVNRTSQPEPLGILTPDQVPITDFLARRYAVCDRWFAPLPADTQPNRLMALSGYTKIDVTRARPLPDQDLVLDWLTRHRVKWRVYHAGLSFFTLFPSMLPRVLGPNFRRFTRLATDVVNEPADDWPKVIFVEPAYNDAPNPFGIPPNDNHPPLPVAFGEHFLREVYLALVQDRTKWAKTMLIVTYDEHGGFFDHVLPLEVPTRPPKGTKYEPFRTTGVRVPAVVVSPLVEEGTVFSESLDHTSILQLLAERFTPGKPYSQEVDERQRGGNGAPPIVSLSAVLNLPRARKDIPTAPMQSFEATARLRAKKRVKNPNEIAFERAAAALVKRYPKETQARLPELSHWYMTRDTREDA